MSIGGVISSSLFANWKTQARSDNTKPTATASSESPLNGPSTDAADNISARLPSDSIHVALPNGFSIGVTHLGAGSSGFDAQLLNSIEGLVGNLYSYPGSAGADATSASAKVAATSESEGNLQGVRGLDTIHVDLPNGISVEVSHMTGSSDADSIAAMNQMESAVEELVREFATYPGANSAKGNDQTASPAASSATSPGGATNDPSKFAAYANQAKWQHLALVPQRTSLV